METTDSSNQPKLALVDDAEELSYGISSRSAAAQLRSTLRAQLNNAADAVRAGLLHYESLRNVSEVIGGEYGDRVIFELVQNAHDAHGDDDEGSILLKLVITDAHRGDLYVANKGKGFSWKNVNAIRNIGVSSKSVGEGIGNKGLGFRSVETLSDDPRIYSQQDAVPADEFAGFCFRFARPDEIGKEALEIADPVTANHVAMVLSRYLAAVPLDDQPTEIREFARAGYATVVHLPLSSADAVEAARKQVSALADVDAPLLLFLDRLARVAIEIEDKGSTRRRTLSRSVHSRPSPSSSSPLSYEIVTIGPGRRRALSESSTLRPGDRFHSVQE